jgi:hypothetical protein
MRKNLRFNFYTAISGYDLRLAQTLFVNQFKVSFGYLPLKMEDTLYRSIQISKNLTKNQEIFLIGIVVGIIRQSIVIESIDQYGDSSTYQELEV